MIGEVAVKAVEVAKKTAEVTAEVTKEVSKGKEFVDISKRIKPGGIASEISMPGKELTGKQAKDLMSKGMSESLVGKCTFKDGIYQLKTINEKLAGSLQAETGVKYVKKTIDLMGSKIEGVFPKFDAAFTAQLPLDKLTASDSIQFSECLSQLKTELKNNPALKEKFTPRQLQQIEQGKMPSGFTWHHNEEVGKMELVDTNKHTLAKHTGGRAIWGNGASAR